MREKVPAYLFFFRGGSITNQLPANSLNAHSTQTATPVSWRVSIYLRRCFFGQAKYCEDKVTSSRGKEMEPSVPAVSAAVLNCKWLNFFLKLGNCF